MPIRDRNVERRAFVNPTKIGTDTRLWFDDFEGTDSTDLIGSPRPGWSATESAIFGSVALTEAGSADWNGAVVMSAGMPGMPASVDLVTEGMWNGANEPEMECVVNVSSVMAPPGSNFNHIVGFAYGANVVQRSSQSFGLFTYQDFISPRPATWHVGHPGVGWLYDTGIIVTTGVDHKIRVKVLSTNALECEIDGEVFVQPSPGGNLVRDDLRGGIVFVNTFAGVGTATVQWVSVKSAR